MRQLDEYEIDTIIILATDKIEDIEKFETMSNEPKWQRSIVITYLNNLITKLEGMKSQ